jgi:photosystem II stability/assembly factor-like uncharacterized protein
MPDEGLRRRLAEALDPGPDFPSSTLLGRSMARLDERESHTAARRRRLLVAVAVAALLGAAVGALRLHAEMLGRTPASGTVVPPRVETAVDYPTVGPDGTAAIVVWAAGGHRGTLYVSTDGGRTWHRSLPLGTRQVAANSGRISGYVRFFEGGSAVVLADALYRSGDRGAHWQRLPLPAAGNSYEACFASPSEGWLRVSGGLGIDEPLYHTTDGGRTWTLAVRTDADHGFRGSEMDADLVCSASGPAGVLTTDVAGPPALHYTLDGGRTWQVSVLPGMPAQIGSTPVAYLIAGSAAVSLDGRVIVPMAGVDQIGQLVPSSTALCTSTDGGRTWLGPLTPPLPEMAAYGIPATLSVGVTDAQGGWWAVDGGSLALSADAGRSWSTRPIPLPPGYHAVTADFASLDRGWVVASDSPLRTPRPPPVHEIVLATDDGGAHWRQVTVPVPAGS